MAAPSAAHPVVRVVRVGDSLSEIAVEQGVSVDDLRRWNKLSGDTIFTGQRLVIERPPGPLENAAATSTRGREYEVKHGDTLSEIAERHGVGLEELLRLNPRLADGHIEIGERVALPSMTSARVVTHRVRSGETLADIARRYAVNVRDLLRWNEGVRPQALSVRQPIKVVSDRQPPSESIGAPWDGRLENGRQPEPHPGYVVRDKSRAWGTQETIAALRQAFDDVARHHERAPRVPVHDISLRHGGPIDDHRSHESGRDVDIIYYQRRCPGGICRMVDVHPQQLLVAPQWTLIRSWLVRGQAQVIFVDYGLQAALYRHARSRGATARQLELWFQYPRDRTAPVGIIRHIPNHRNHLHVRFVCPRGDHECR